MIHLHHIQHVAFEGPGSIAAWAKDNRCVLTATHLYRGDQLPTPDAFDCLMAVLLESLPLFAARR